MVCLPSCAAAVCAWRCGRGLAMSRAQKQGGIKLSPAGVEWVSVARDGDTRKRRVIRAAAVSRAEWCRFGSSCQLKLVALERGADKKGKGKEAAPRVTYRFDGFSTKDYSAVQAVVEKKWNKQLEPTDVASKGGNWGELQFAGACSCITASCAVAACSTTGLPRCNAR